MQFPGEHLSYHLNIVAFGCIHNALFHHMPEWVRARMVNNMEIELWILRLIGLLSKR